MDLIEIETKQKLQREEAAAWLHELADHLARHNDIEFKRDGIRYNVAVPKEVTLEVELEIGDDGTSLEVEISF